MRATWIAAARVAVAGLFATGCSNGAGGAADGGAPCVGAPRSELLDPTTCVNCHEDHYNDWAASMHAYAADDPVFLAMNARGQRETDGGLGTFCVNCHAPMAVRDGKTTDGLNLASLPAKYRGVTCFFCHSIASVDGTHNAQVTVADDLVMRGEYANPVPNSMHQAKYSALHDDAKKDSAAMCGACHDIAIPPPLAADAGTHLERTFAEWQASAFSATMGGETCNASSCHMVRLEPQRPIAQQTGYRTSVPSARYFHKHDFPAIDVRLSPGADAAAPEPPGVQALLSNAIVGDLCVTGRGAIRVVLDTPNVGHGFPSGATQDRRLWAEVVAYEGTTIVYQSGAVPLGAPTFDAQKDPDMWLLRDCIFDTQGSQVHMFWQAASYEGNELPALATFDVSSPNYKIAQRVRYFPRTGEPPTSTFDRVTLNVWVQPVGLDVLNDLVSSGDLDPSVVATMPTLPVPLSVQAPGILGSSQLEWTSASAVDGGVAPYRDEYDDTTVTCVGTLPLPGPLPASNHVRCSP